MPLTTRSISPVNISVGRLPPGLQSNELECVANGTLANLVRQMSSLSRHAHHIFSEIHRQILECDKRIEKVHERNLRLQDKIDQPNYNNPAPGSIFYYSLYINSSLFSIVGRRSIEESLQK